MLLKAASLGLVSLPHKIILKQDKTIQNDRLINKHIQWNHQKKTNKKNPTTSYYAFIFIICIYNFFVNIDLWISLAWDQETLWDLLRSNPYSTQNLHTKFSGEDRTYKPSHLWIKFYTTTGCDKRAPYKSNRWQLFSFILQPCCAINYT